MTDRRLIPNLSRLLMCLLVAPLTLALAPGVVRAAPAHATASSRSAARGHWSVVRLAPGRWQVSWTSPRRLPVRTARPQIVDTAGDAVGVPTTTPDGRTVRTVVSSATAPSPARLGVLLSGTRLDRTATPMTRLAPAATPAQSPSTPARILDADPGVAGPYATTSSDYVRPSVKVAGMRQPIEMVGHVVEPVADAQTGPRPLVVFLHGRHDYCYQAAKGTPNDDWPCHGVMREVPSQLGYTYVQQLLASQGFTTVSIRVNGINAQDGVLPDGGASARATIVARHLDYWATIAAAHQVDLSRVVLVGHSRGGEGADRASIRIPLSAPYRIVGQVLVAPTDFANQTAADVPTVTLLPYCDGDVSDLEGQRYTDVSRDLSTGDRSLKSSVLIMGANHNFFNTEWTPGISAAPSSDDWYGDPKALCGTKTPARLTPAGQRAVGQAYIAGAAQLFTDPARAPSLLPMFDGSRVAVRSAGNAVVLSHSLGGDRVLRRPGTDASLTLAQGADSSFCAGSVSDDFQPALCGSGLGEVTAPLWGRHGEQPAPARTFWQVAWTARGQVAGLHLNQPLDLRSRSLDLRTIVDFRQGPAAIRVRVTDAAGHSAELTPEGGGTLDPLPASPPGGFEQVAKLWAQDVRIDPAPAASTVDLAHVSDVEIVSDSTRGRLWIADLASTAGTLPALTAARLPVLSIDTSSVPEGNADGTAVARVPFRLSRPMDRPGKFRVLTVGQRPGDTRVLTIDLAPGQQSGTISVGYQGDRLDSFDRLETTIVGVATSNVSLDEYVGQLAVLDDDPSPKVTITPVRREVSEGGTAQWRVSLSRETDYDISVEGLVVRGPGRILIGSDVPASWLEAHRGREGKPSTTLAGLRTEVFVDVQPGTRGALLSIPIRRDGVREGAETVTLRITCTVIGVAGFHPVSTSTVVVKPSA